MLTFQTVVQAEELPLVVNVILSIWGILDVRLALPFPAAAADLTFSLPW